MILGILRKKREQLEKSLPMIKYTEPYSREVLNRVREVSIRENKQRRLLNILKFFKI